MLYFIYQKKERYLKMTNLDTMIICSCPICGKEYGIYVNGEDDFNWSFKGVLTQDAFPYLSASERESLISGICSECWDDMFGEEEEEEENNWDDEPNDEYLEMGFNPYEGCYDWDC
jgi:hypothetical protein